MIYIPIKELPTGFHPYPFKSFRMKALTIDQAMKLGTAPTDRDIRNLMGNSPTKSTPTCLSRRTCAS